MPGSLRESHKIVIKGPAAAGEDLTRSWYKNLARASQKSFRTSTFDTWHLQDLHARTSERGSYQDGLKIFWQGPVQDHSRTSCKELDFKIFMQGPLKEDLTRMATRSSDEDLYKIVQGPLAKDLTRIFTRSSHKDLRKIMQEDVSRIFASSSHKDLYKMMQVPRTGFHQDLHKIISQGLVQDIDQESDPTRTKCREGCTSHLKISTAQTARAIWQAQSDEKVARAIPKWAPRHSESDPTGPKWQEGCGSTCQIFTKHRARATKNEHCNCQKRRFT